MNQQEWAIIGIAAGASVVLAIILVNNLLSNPDIVVDVPEGEDVGNQWV